MENLESLKDPQTLMATSSLIGVIIASVYFQNKYTELENQIVSLKEYIDTNMPSDGLDKKIDILDAKLKSLIKEFDHLKNNSSEMDEIRGYERLTKRQCSDDEDTTVEEEIRIANNFKSF